MSVGLLAHVLLARGMSPKGIQVGTPNFVRIELARCSRIPVCTTLPELHTLEGVTLRLRRLDVIELCSWCEAMGIPAGQFVAELEQKLD